MPQAIKKSAKNTQPQMRKRHWALGLCVILGGSWITHTTTATIASPTKVKTESVVTDQVVDTNTLDLDSLNSSTSGIDNAAQKLVSVTNELEQKPLEELRSEVHTVKRGESLGTIFRKKSLDMSLPHHISKHEVASKLVSLSIGKELEFKFDSNNQLRAIEYPITALTQLNIDIEDSLIVNANIEELAYQTVQKKVSGEINSSLYLSANEAGLSNNFIMEMVRIFGWDIDFVQDIRRGDSFHVIYDEHHLNGVKLSDGNILAAEFTTQGQTYRAIRFEDEQGTASYYTPEGESMLGTFLRSPVEFSRISSRFGRRKHPISKKWKAHKGVDYAAARGTPIRATADGKVRSAGRKGGYGNTVVINHAGRFSTLYAHMKGFAKGIRSGSRVKQGQIIGYVGTTGYSTGPHLHYEFRVDGVHRNSLTYKTPKASSVDKARRSEFDQIAHARQQELDGLLREYQLAKATTQNKSL